MYLYSIMFPPKATCTTPDSGLLSTFKLMLLEHMILCRMVQGQMPQAIKEVNKITCVGMLNTYPGLTCTHTCKNLKYDGLAD